MKRQTLRISQRTGQTDVALQGFMTATSEHGRAKIRRDYLSSVPQVAGKGQGQVGCATAHIEEACSRRYMAIGYCLLAPIVVQPKAKYGVEHGIILVESGRHL